MRTFAVAVVILAGALGSWLHSDGLLVPLLQRL